MLICLWSLSEWENTGKRRLSILFTYWIVVLTPVITEVFGFSFAIPDCSRELSQKNCMWLQKVLLSQHNMTFIMVDHVVLCKNLCFTLTMHFIEHALTDRSAVDCIYTDLAEVVDSRIVGRLLWTWNIQFTVNMIWLVMKKL